MGKINEAVTFFNGNLKPDAKDLHDNLIDLLGFKDNDNFLSESDKFFEFCLKERNRDSDSEFQIFAFLAENYCDIEDNTVIGKISVLHETLKLLKTKERHPLCRFLYCVVKGQNFKDVNGEGYEHEKILIEFLSLLSGDLKDHKFPKLLEIYISSIDGEILKKHLKEYSTLCYVPTSIDFKLDNRFTSLMQHLDESDKISSIVLSGKDLEFNEEELKSAAEFIKTKLSDLPRNFVGIFALQFAENILKFLGKYFESNLLNLIFNNQDLIFYLYKTKINNTGNDFLKRFILVEVESEKLSDFVLKTNFELLKNIDISPIFNTSYIFVNFLVNKLEKAIEAVLNSCKELNLNSVNILYAVYIMLLKIKEFAKLYLTYTKKIPDFIPESFSKIKSLIKKWIDLLLKNPQNLSEIDLYLFLIYTEQITETTEQDDDFNEKLIEYLCKIENCDNTETMLNKLPGNFNPTVKDILLYTQKLKKIADDEQMELLNKTSLNFETSESVELITRHFLKNSTPPDRFFPIFQKIVKELNKSQDQKAQFMQNLLCFSFSELMTSSQTQSRNFKTFKEFIKNNKNWFEKLKNKTSLLDFILFFSCEIDHKFMKEELIDILSSLVDLYIIHGREYILRAISKALELLMNLDKELKLNGKSLYFLKKLLYYPNVWQGLSSEQIEKLANAYKIDFEILKKLKANKFEITDEIAKWLTEDASNEKSDGGKIEIFKLIMEYWKKISYFFNNFPADVFNKIKEEDRLLMVKKILKMLSLTREVKLTPVNIIELHCLTFHVVVKSIYRLEYNEEEFKFVLQFLKDTSYKQFKMLYQNKSDVDAQKKIPVYIFELTFCAYLLNDEEMLTYIVTFREVFILNDSAKILNQAAKDCEFNTSNAINAKNKLIQILNERRNVVFYYL